MSRIIPIRNDTGVKFLANVERDFILSCALRENRRVLRTDGRVWNQLRSSRLSLTRWENGATCTTQWGKGTRVSCTCTAELLPPNPDRPNEGMVALSVDLSPSASTAFRQAAPVTTGGSSFAPSRSGPPPDEDQKLLSNRILRSLERVLLTGGALDTEALCVTPQYWVWKLSLAVTVLDDGGNLMDASVLAALAALRHYRKPHVELATEGSNSGVPPRWIQSDLKEPVPLPLHHTPLSISFALLPHDTAAQSTASAKVTLLVDPDAREELVSVGTLSIAMNVHGEVCLLDFGGGCELATERLREAYRLAAQHVQDLCQALETSLQQADEQALRDRLSRLQARQHPGYQLPDSTTKQIPAIPFYTEIDMEDVTLQIDATDTKTESKQAQTEAEEAYRRQALDYNIGHVASKVRENKVKSQASKSQQPSTLLKAMLRSAQTLTETTRSTDVNENATDGPEIPAGPSTEPIQLEGEPSETKSFVNSIAVPTPMTIGTDKKIDSDEEDATMQLKSEFESVELAKASQSPKVAQVKEDEEKEVNDLAAAIKKKKPKGKRSKR
jgi:exosome complex component RRP45